MKNFIFLLLLITVTKFYAQNESFTLKYSGLLNYENPKNSTLGNEYKANSNEIISFKSSFIESNSDGKFLEYIFDEAESILIEKATEKFTQPNSLKEKSVTIFLKDDLVRKLTQKFTAKKAIKTDNKKEYFKYDKEIIADKFNKVVYDDSFTIQIGKNIYEYINKLYKSDVDKTFVNELNLLVVNF